MREKRRQEFLKLIKDIYPESTLEERNDYLRRFEETLRKEVGADAQFEKRGTSRPSGIMKSSRPTVYEQDENYRKNMRDAGRGHLLP